MAEAFIVEAVRTPVGKRGGGLSAVHPADLAATVLREVVERSGIDPNEVDDVILGCVDQVGPQASNIARTAWLSADLPEQVPGTTIDRQCGSSQQALHFAAQAIKAGSQDLVVAGGVQNMSIVRMGASRPGDLPDPRLDAQGWRKRYGTQEISQFRGAEMMAEKWGISREEMEAFAEESHRRALSAREQGVFTREIVPLAGVSADEGPRTPDIEKMRSLPTLLEGGRMTAAVSSQVSDGAAALLLASETAVRDHRLRPRARIHTMTVAGDDPIMMLSAPIPATKKALSRAGLALSDISRFEMNEAFAPVVLSWAKELGVDLERTNVCGGAIALGHPLGATGARLMTTLLHELERSGGRYGLQAMCEGGGQANVTIIESLA